MSTECKQALAKAEKQIESLKKEIYLYKRDGEKLYEDTVKFQQRLDDECQMYKKLRLRAMITSPHASIILDLEKQIRIRDAVISSLLNKSRIRVK